MTSLKAIQKTAPGTVHEVMWGDSASYFGPIRTGKVHFVTPESVPRTLCGISVPLPSKHVMVAPRDERCKKCRSKLDALMEAR